MKWILKACIYSLFAVLPPLTQANQVTARVITPLIVAVAENSGKNPLLSVEERTEIVAQELARINAAANIRECHVYPPN